MNALAQLAGRVWFIDRTTMTTMMEFASKIEAGALTGLGDPDADRGGFELLPNGDAIVRVHGPIESKPTLFGMLFGASSYPAITKAAITANADSRVRRVVLDVDSPGGEAIGAHETATAIAALSKPTVARVTGTALSAGYWLASACDRIEANPMARIGCIGAVIGIAKGSDRVVEFVSESTPLKRAAPEGEGADSWQQLVNDSGEIFLNDIATNRGVDRETIDANYGRGAEMLAPRALTAGMIDAVTDPASTTARGVPGAKKGVTAMADAQVAPVGAEEDGEPTREDLIQRISELEDKLAEAEGAESEAEAEANTGDVAAMSRVGLKALNGRLVAENGNLAARLTAVETEQATSKVADRDRRITAMQIRGALGTSDHAVSMACLAWNHEPATFVAMEASADNSAVSTPVTPGSRGSHGDPEIAPDTKTAASIRAAAKLHGMTVTKYRAAERRGTLKALEGGS